MSEPRKEFLNFKETSEYIGINEDKVRRLLSLYNEEHPDEPISFTPDKFDRRSYRITFSAVEKLRAFYNG